MRVAKVYIGGKNSFGHKEVEDGREHEGKSHRQNGKPWA